MLDRLMCCRLSGNSFSTCHDKHLPPHRPYSLPIFFVTITRQSSHSPQNTIPFFSARVKHLAYRQLFVLSSPTWQTTSAPFRQQGTKSTSINKEKKETLPLHHPSNFPDPEAIESAHNLDHLPKRIALQLRILSQISTHYLL